MKNLTCPGCGAGYNGKRCRSCGYTAFPEEGRSGKTPSPARPAARGKRKRHPFIGFLILLALIWALLPLLKNWGLKLEAMEDHAQSSYQSARETQE